MNRHIAIIGAVLMLTSPVRASGGDASHQATYEIPRVARAASRPLPAPIWVSSRAAFDKEGRLEANQFNDIDRRLINQNIAANSAGECRVAIGAPPLEQFAPRNSLDALIANSLAIVSGKVVGADTGFYFGTPGTLYLIHVLDVAKSFGRVAHANPLLLFIPEVTIRTPHGTICSKAVTRVPIPAIGDTVLIFSYDDAQDTDGRLVTVDMQSQLVVQRGEHLFAPPVIAAPSSATSFAGVAEIVSKIRESAHVAEVPAPPVIR